MTAVIVIQLQQTGTNTFGLLKHLRIFHVLLTRHVEPGPAPISTISRN